LYALGPGLQHRLFALATIHTGTPLVGQHLQQPFALFFCLVAGFFQGSSDTLALLQIGPVAARQAKQLTGLQVVDRGSHPAQEGPVVGNQPYGPRIGQQQLFQAQPHTQVQVGGWLVKQ